MTRPPDVFDVAVIGCGPAGTVVSRELRRFGYRVAAVGAPRRFSAFEGISERAWEGFSSAGCRHAVSAAGPEVRRIAHWNGERFEGNRERVVDRRALDSALLRDIEDAGVRLFKARPKNPRRCADGWLIALGEGAVVARFLVDARGRAAPRSRTSWRLGPAAMALGRRWRLGGRQRAMTWLETFESGWIWYATDGTDAAVQLIVSTETTPLPPRPHLSGHFEALLSAVPGIEALLSGATPTGAVHARDARSAVCREPVSRDVARVGDAAFAIDPLSGHGMFEALSGALALAPVVNTLFKRPGDADTAFGFYRDKLNSDFMRMARTGRDFYRHERRWPDASFWRERYNWPDDRPAHNFAGAARVEKRPVSDEGLIRLREVIVTGDHPRGVWRVAGVPLVDLLRFLKSRVDQADDRVIAAAARHFRSSPEDVAAASGWLRWRGLLEP